MGWVAVLVVLGLLWLAVVLIAKLVKWLIIIAVVLFIAGAVRAWTATR